MHHWRGKNTRLVIATILVSLFSCLAAEGQQKKLGAKNPRIERQLAESAALLSAGDFAGAKAILQKIISAAPSDATAHTLAGIVADRENDLPKAEKHFALAAKFAPASPETRNNYGAILLRLNRRAEAAREFSAALAANPAQASALVNLGQIRLAENDFRAARSLFEKAKTAQPDAEIARALVVISLRLGESERAATEFRDYAALADGANLKAAARAELGATLLENGLVGEAIGELEAAVALDPSDVEFAVLLSRAYVSRRDFKAAGRLLETKVAGGADDARIYAALADVYEAAGYPENAIPAMRLAVEKSPRNENFRYRYGMLLVDSQAPAAAVIRLAEAVKEFPDSARLWLALGIAQQGEGKSLDARRSFERALAIEPRLIPALAYSATISIEQGRYDEAVVIYERALSFDERNAILHYLLADTLLKIPNADAARIRRHLERAVVLDEKLAQAHLALGKLYTRSEEWQKAAEEFEKAARYAPEVAEAHYQFGRALARLKRTDESKAAFEKHKKLNEAQAERKRAQRQDLVRRLANVRF